MQPLENETSENIFGPHHIVEYVQLWEGDNNNELVCIMELHQDFKEVIILSPYHFCFMTGELIEGKSGDLCSIM